MSPDRGPNLNLLREHGTAAFRYGVAWGTPVLTRDGLRGVGVTDFHRAVTRVVQIGLPERVLGQIEGRRAGNPIRRFGFRLIAVVLRRVSAARELRFESGSIWIRDGSQGDWERVPSNQVDDPARQMANDPTWVLQLLHPPDDVRLPRGIEDELNVDGASPADIELSVTLGEEGAPRRVGVLLPSGRAAGGAIWEVLEFVAYGVSPDQLDLWHEWERARGAAGGLPAREGTAL